MITRNSRDDYLDGAAVHVVVDLPRLVHTDQIIPVYKMVEYSVEGAEQGDEGTGDAEHLHNEEDEQHLGVLLTVLKLLNLFAPDGRLVGTTLGAAHFTLAANGLALNLEKCVFAVPALDFLHHRISAASVARLRDNVQVILDFPTPRDFKALQRFLGMANFYPRFLPGIARTLQPLTAVLAGNPKALTWLPNMSAAFTATKAALVAAVPLAHPRPDARLSLATDPSDTHVLVVLQQQVGQHWQPLGFFSKKLSKTEVNYSTFDRELLAALPLPARR